MICGLVRGFIKGRRISDVVWRLRVFFPDDGHRLMVLDRRTALQELQRNNEYLRCAV